MIHQTPTRMESHFSLRMEPVAVSHLHVHEGDTNTHKSAKGSFAKEKYEKGAKIFPFWDGSSNKAG